MPSNFAREAPKLWRKICNESSAEASLLLAIGNLFLLVSFVRSSYAYLLCIKQYIHGLATHGIHYLHRPGPILQDAGFFLVFTPGTWTRQKLSDGHFTRLFFKSKKIYTVLIWCRVFAYLALSQFLLIITFYSTQFPGPNYHCREDSEVARLPPPKSALEVLYFPRAVMYGCGDMIFSSHMIFTLVFVRTFQRYGTRK